MAFGSPQRAPIMMEVAVQVAMGFIKVANATMCRPIQALTQMRGYDVAQHVLACFGGAGELWLSMHAWLYWVTCVLFGHAQPSPASKRMK